MKRPEPCRIEPATVARLYVEHAEELRWFLQGVLGDSHLVSDVLQTAFVKAIESGHTAHEESLKGWLFQVAYREALLARRRAAVHDKALQAVAAADERPSDDPAVIVTRKETVRQVRSAVRDLPQEQREVVRLRMYDGLKFAEIARRLGVPLGTVLTRMQLALGKLRKKLEK